jgi:hypothetical protein
MKGQEDSNLKRQTAKGKAPAEHFPQSGPSRLNEAAQGGRFAKQICEVLLPICPKVCRSFADKQDSEANERKNSNPAETGEFPYGNNS